MTDHCALDLDQKAMEEQLSLGTPDSYAKARAIYNNGGHSKSHAKVTLASTDGLKSKLAKGTQILGKSADGTQVSGKAGGNYEVGDRELKVYYTTTDVQATYVGCQVGALQEPMLAGCFTENGDLTIDGEDYAYTYDAETQNDADRTL